MSLSPNDYRLLRERRKLISRWPMIGGGSLFFLLLLYAWLAFSSPLLVNPLHVYNALLNNELAPDLLEMLALMAPVWLMLVIVILGVMLALGFVIMRREKRLLDIIDRLISGTQP